MLKDFGVVGSYIYVDVNAIDLDSPHIGGSYDKQKHKKTASWNITFRN